MLSKILTGGFILIMVGAVVAGAIAVFGPSAEAHGGPKATEYGSRPGQGLGPGAQGQGLGQDQGQGQGFGQGQGRGQGRGQGQGRAEGVQSSVTPLNTETIEGIVVETNELVVESASGKTLTVGLGPSTYRESKGFVLEPGETVRVSGYWEDDEFKAIQLENLTTGQSIVLRDATGRPMWAGQGRGKNRSS